MLVKLKVAELRNTVNVGVANTAQPQHIPSPFSRRRCPLYRGRSSRRLSYQQQYRSSCIRAAGDGNIWFSARLNLRPGSLGIPALRRAQVHDPSDLFTILHLPRWSQRSARRLRLDPQSLSTATPSLLTLMALMAALRQSGLLPRLRLRRRRRYQTLYHTLRRRW